MVSNLLRIKSKPLIRASKALHIPLPLSLTLCPTTLPRWPFCYSWNTQANSPSRTLHLLCPLPPKLCPQIFTMAFSFPLFMCQLKPHLLGGVFPNYPVYLLFSPTSHSLTLLWFLHGTWACLESGWPLDRICTTCFLGLDLRTHLQKRLGL